MGDSSSAPAAPVGQTAAVTQAQQDAAAHAAATGEQMFQWAKNEYAKNSGNSDEFVNNALKQDQTLNGNAGTDRGTYDSTFTPTLKAQQGEAESYLNGSRDDAAMGAAQANVAQQFEGARHAATQQLEGYGIQPSDTRMAALDIGTRTQEAAAKAAAGTTAAVNNHNTGLQLQQQVLANSTGLGNQATNETTAGANIGAAGVNAGNSTTATGASTMGSAPQYAAIQASDLTGADNSINSGYQNQLNEFKANQTASSGVGSALGAAAGLGIKAAGLFVAKGGAIDDPSATPGGAIPNDASPTGGSAVDDVPARLTAGEFVMPKDVTNWYGEKHMQTLIQKARQERQKVTAKPAIGPAPTQAPTFQSRPQGAIPMGA